jgi:tetratricopeptide (TPR) repeat protein
LIGDLNVKYLKGGWPFKHEDEANSFVESYRYTSYVDSMAFAYITEAEEDMHIEDEHIKLALYYSKNGRPDKAFDEYYSIIKEHPYVADLYYDASKYLITQRKFKEALELIYSAPNMERDYFYHYMLGTLQIKLSMLDQATNNLERAYSIITKDVNPMKVLAPLLVAYREKEDSENQERILLLIKQIDPEFGKTNEQAKRTLANTDVTYEDVLSKAKQLLASRQFKNAEKLLLSLNRVEETFESSKLLGAAYLAQNEIDQAYVYCQKAYDLDPKDVLNTDNLYILNLYKADINTAAKLLNELRFLDLKEGRLKQLEDAFENRINELESK